MARILETPRLLLRHLEPADLAPLYSLYSDPEVRQYFPDGTRTLDDTKEELEAFLNGHPKAPELGLWATIEKATGAFLGRCGLLPWDIAGRREVELAFLIDKRRWREGLATEASQGIIDYAARSLKLRRLICLIHPENVRSIATARKVGMGFERDYTDEFGYCHIYARALQTPEVRLEEFRPELARDLVLMWRESFEFGVGITDPHSLEDQEQALLEKVAPHNTVRVAFLDRQMVGFVAATPTSIAQLYVRKGFHRRGIGSRLLQWAKEQSSGSLRLYTFARNAGAQAFYERHGFSIRARGHEPEWDLDDVKYEWTAS
jgi:[ribosomal protein S5]-alanine N-acetyltransferase